jgi:hypothetical protein
MKRDISIDPRRAGVLGLALATCAVAGLAGGALAEPWRVIPAERVVIEVNTDAVVRESLPNTLFGFNINYKPFQEQLWDAHEHAPKPGIVSHLKHFEGALYRYPGGLVANGFDWSEAVGSVTEREPQQSVIGGPPAKALFGLKEYLDFVQQVGGRPVYVLNLVGLDPTQPLQEADKGAVAEHNRTLARTLVKYLVEQLGSAEVPHYYQLGNELDRADYEWSHEKYVDRARASVEAIREVDRNARFVAFLRDFRWTYRREPGRGVSEPEDFLRDVMQGLPLVEDYSLHHYYDGKRSDGRGRDVPFWLRLLTTSIATYRATHDGKAPRIWITEHARQKSSDRAGQDGTREYTSNLGGAISTADYLIALAQIPEVQGVCWHGLNAGPWQLFDATLRYRDLRPRPVYWGLRVLREMKLPVVLQTHTHSPNHSGYPGGYDVRAVAFRDQAGHALGLWVVNRAPRPLQAEVEYRRLSGQDMLLKHYFLAGKAGVDPDAAGLEPTWDLEPEMKRVKLSSEGRLLLDLPPASISTFMLRPPSTASVGGGRVRTDTPEEASL